MLFRSIDRVEGRMEGLHVADALTEIFTVFKRCNKYIDETEPWVLAKDDAKKDRLATVLYNLVESICIGASLFEPYMPSTAAKITASLNTNIREFADLHTFGAYPSGNEVTKTPEILFARLDLKEVKEKADAMFQARKAEADAKAAKNEIGRAHV